MTTRPACPSSTTTAISRRRKFTRTAGLKTSPQVWLGGRQVAADGSVSYFGDHYKWRVMRSNGVPEDYITGDKPDRERFQKFAESLEMAIGNPMYTWCHLELKKYFGYEGVLTPIRPKKSGTSATTNCRTTRT